METFYIVPRQEWNARPPRSVFGLARPPKTILARWTNSALCHDRATCLRAMEALQRDHMDGGMEDIGYNFVVGGDDVVYEGRGWKVVGMTTKHYEPVQHKSILVGCIGKEEMTPTSEKIEAVDNLITFGKKMGFLTEYTNFVPMFDMTQYVSKLGTSVNKATDQ